jgi:hypothetical protein
VRIEPITHLLADLQCFLPSKGSSQCGGIGALVTVTLTVSISVAISVAIKPKPNVVVVRSDPPKPPPPPPAVKPDNPRERWWLVVVLVILVLGALCYSQANGRSQAGRSVSHALSPVASPPPGRQGHIEYRATHHVDHHRVTHAHPRGD